jgi:hypothetical protein
MPQNITNCHTERQYADLHATFVQNEVESTSHAGQKKPPDMPADGGMSCRDAMQAVTAGAARQNL